MVELIEPIEPLELIEPLEPIEPPRKETSFYSPHLLFLLRYH